MSIEIKQQLVSEDIIRQRSYGYGNKKLYIVVHQTGNTSRGANAQAHANIQSRLNPRKASWHYQVDDKDIIQSFPDDVHCWAAGVGRSTGNLDAIQIELCINVDNDYKKTLKNGAKLIKRLMDMYNIPLSRVTQHYDWNRKNCPAQIRAGKDGINWQIFLNMVQGVKAEEVKEAVQPKPSALEGDYTGNSIVEYLVSIGVNSSFSNRSKLAAEYGISNYAGTAQQNLELLNTMRDGAIVEDVAEKDKTVAEIAREVLDGKWGNNPQRRQRLEQAGYDYSAVQSEVNRLASGHKPKPPKKSVSAIAREVLDGKWGNNPQRRQRLETAGYNYAAVQAQVNKLASGTPKKSIDQMAREILEGKHGNGHANRRRSLGISQSEYDKVRRRVNQLA